MLANYALILLETEVTAPPELSQPTQITLRLANCLSPSKVAQPLAAQLSTSSALQPLAVQPSNSSEPSRPLGVQPPANSEEIMKELLKITV